MRIGILTFHRARNYGAVLQAYGLQEVLKKMGHYVEIIDYRPEVLSRVYNTSLNFKDIKKLLGSLISYPFRKIRGRLFEGFNSKYLNISKFSFTKHIQADVSYDAIFFGSDQVWNPEITGGIDDIYWGNFKTNKKILKIAYAASAGGEIELLSQYDGLEKLLENFDSISVREDDLNNLISSRINGTVTTVLDPTLLITEKFWSDIASPVVSGKYLLLYQVNPNKDALFLAERIAEKYNLKIVEIWNGFNFRDAFGKKLFVSPNEFVSLFKYAQYVITTSFHGAAFSLIFRKNFYYVGGSLKNESRISQLLDKFSLSDRFIRQSDLAKMDFSDIDWAGLNVDVKLQNLRKLSLKFIKNSLISRL